MVFDILILDISQIIELLNFSIFAFCKFNFIKSCMNYDS